MDRVYVRQLVRSFRVGELTRREFLRRATLTVGSAAALKLLAACAATPPNAPNEPVAQAETPEAIAAATTVTAEGLVAENITYNDSDGNELMGFLAYPEGGSDLPGVVLIQEWWGLNEHIRDVARRLANEGFAVLAVDLYDGVSTSEPDEAQKLVMELDQAAAVQEIGAAASYLQTQAYVGSEQIGVMGFCLGGALALQAGRAHTNVGATIAFYGRTPPPEQAAEIQSPVLGLYGSEDQGIPVSDVEAMQAALTDAGIPNEIQVYEGAGHAFFNDTRESYDEAAAADAWTRSLAWLREYL